MSNFTCWDIDLEYSLVGINDVQEAIGAKAKSKGATTGSLIGWR